jgi:hypothetical protein
MNVFCSYSKKLMLQGNSRERTEERQERHGKGREERQ